MRCQWAGYTLPPLAPIREAQAAAAKWRGKADEWKKKAEEEDSSRKPSENKA